ncbi:hypothetical protein [Verrucosispora sp. WMMD573]|uniref:hypothetical protein n=1 Tax=Verrucosispora sp. WMMD573 TaxID=3015149 RepID=UPI00248B55B4|nr:hypothetical protein [Verrucosispora sp. WMMD573]WBB55383.1 hypothetical protein O7601_04440 [Verrucosispora sp. WMMD573]
MTRVVSVDPDLGQVLGRGSVFLATPVDLDQPRNHCPFRKPSDLRCKLQVAVSIMIDFYNWHRPSKTHDPELSEAWRESTLYNILPSTEHLRHSVEGSHPVREVRADPTEQSKDRQPVGGKVPIMNRLVMRDVVPECPDVVEVRIEGLSSASVVRERVTECRAPETSFVVARSAPPQQADPKPKGQFSHHVAMGDHA